MADSLTTAGGRSPLCLLGIRSPLCLLGVRVLACLRAIHRCIQLSHTLALCKLALGVHNASPMVNKVQF